MLHRSKFKFTRTKHKKERRYFSKRLQHTTQTCMIKQRTITRKHFEKPNSVSLITKFKFTDVKISVPTK